MYAAFLAPHNPMAIQATGMPGGICAIVYRESTPFILLEAIGTHIIGRVGQDAKAPGKAADPPAPAIITSIPLLAAFFP